MILMQLLSQRLRFIHQIVKNESLKKKKNDRYIYIYIYIYIVFIVIHRQTVSFNQNSSVWLCKQTDAAAAVTT